MGKFDDVYDAIHVLEELREDVESRIDGAVALLRKLIEPGPVDAVTEGLAGTVKEEQAVPLTWYPAPEHIAQVRDRFANIVTDERMRDLTARFIRWHENQGKTLPYPGASQRWLNWVSKEAQALFAESLTSTGLGDVVSSTTHRRPTRQEVDDAADEARSIKETDPEET